MNQVVFHENEPLGGTHFDMNGFARSLVLLQREQPARNRGVDRIFQRWGGGGVTLCQNGFQRGVTDTPGNPPPPPSYAHAEMAKKLLVCYKRLQALMGL